MGSIEMPVLSVLSVREEATGAPVATPRTRNQLTGPSAERLLASNSDRVEGQFLGRP